MSLRTFLPLLVLSVLVSSCELVPDDAASVQSPIIGGTAVTDGSWPAVGGIILEPDSMCSGTLISPKVVVTAAHCVKGENPSTFILGFDMDTGTQYPVKTAVYNPNYDSGGYNDPGSGDVAILVLEDEITTVTPAELFTGDFTKFDGKSITFVGYGKRDVYQPLYGRKYQVTLTIQDIDDDGFWNYTSQSDVHNTCGGDSGGPGFILSGGKYYIGGFVSSGDEYCVEDGYNMRADSNADWILSQVEKYDPGFLQGAECGNDECEYGENSGNCPQDCPVVEPECGNDICEDGEDEDNCFADCGTVLPDIWAPCGTNGECPNGQFCIQVSQSGYYCTIECTDLELGGGCGYQDMACYPLQDGGGACIPADISCGDGLCEYGETAASCAADCDVDCGDLTYEGCCDGTTAIYCSNGQFRTVECGPDYGCGWVAEDGGYYFCTGEAIVADPSGTFPMSCNTYTWGEVDTCGNDKCDNGETNASCPQDCTVVDECGNQKCDEGENSTTCPQDCPSPTECGNGTCEKGETPLNCAKDCPLVVEECGNGTCGTGEDQTSCPEDCGSTEDCGDGVCASGESCRSCPADCGACPVDQDVIEGSDATVAGDTGTVGDEGGEGEGGGGCSAGPSRGSSPVALLLMLFPIAAFGLRAARRRA